MSSRLAFFLYLTLAAIAAAPAAIAQADLAATVELELTARHDLGPPARPSKLLAEVAKQAVEQPLHFAMAAGPIWLSRCLSAVPWYGWAIMPALAYREWRQWPSERWWDPPLDAAFFLLGAITATWSAKLRPPPLPVLRRRHWRVAGWPRA